jgi:hypothetical protein
VEIALKNYQRFKSNEIATLPQGGFEVEIDVDRYIS